jgi:hypothetical protein
MKLVKKTKVSAAVARALALQMQHRKEEAERRRAVAANEVINQLCKQLMKKQSLKTMQEFVDNFSDSRADTICNAILEATTFAGAREFVMNVMRAMKVVTIQHCHDCSTGVLRHVFRIKEPEMIPSRHEVVSSDLLTGLTRLEASLPKKKGGLLGGNYIMEECQPWAPYHKEILPAVAQNLLRQRQTEQGAEWHLFPQRGDTLH